MRERPTILLLHAGPGGFDHSYLKPTVCVGELDPVTPVEASREIADAVPDGLGRLEVLPGVGDFPWRDAPDALFEVLAEFVRAAYGVESG